MYFYSWGTQTPLSRDFPLAQRHLRSGCKPHNTCTTSEPLTCILTRADHVMSLQVTRVVLLWVNNHFNDFEGDPAMTHFLEEFENNLEKEVSVTTHTCIIRVQSMSHANAIYRTFLTSVSFVFNPENVWAPQTVKYSVCC